MARPLFFSPQKATKIHEATLTVLEKTGVKLDHEEAEALYLKAGATKDDEGRVLIPPKMVAEAIEKAQHEIRLYNRDGKKPLRITNGKTYFGPGSDALYNIDRNSGERRNSSLSDVANNLAVDVIDEVARRDDLYLAHPHTTDHFRESLWIPPSFIERRKTEEREDASELTNLLAEEVDRKLNNHKPKQLPEGKIQQIDKYLGAL
jgi:trimethylamine:corrinoid methyltransferase-like protein